MKRLNTDQASFQRFARILKERYSRVVVWAGAGVSKPAKSPTWLELLEYVRGQARVKAESLDSSGRQLATTLISKADAIPDFWAKFSILKRVLGPSTYPIVVREAFANQEKSPPKFYAEMWKLGIQGFITTNLDRYAARAGSLPELSGTIVEFDARDSSDYAYLLRTHKNCVLNVHGRLDADSSWVLTADELANLMRLPEYWAMLGSWLRNSAVLFAGCSPDDVSVAIHLAQLKASGLRLEGHYWLTNRDDHKADEWAEEHGLSRIYFDARDGNFEGIDEFLFELRRFTGHDEPPPIVVPSIPELKVDSLLSPEELLLEPSVNRLRAVLNAEARRILTSGKPETEKNSEYEEFTSRYEEVLHRAWFVSTTKGAEFFDLYIYDTLKKGAFGQVYDAIDDSGNHVALKVLHGNVKDDPTMLTCFRRGVEAMRLLAQYGVDGVVPYLKAWEIPTCAVMDLIDGVNLQEAVEHGQINSWYEILRVAHSLSSIIRRAHSTPAGVLHRDLRPANIMLEGKEDQPGRKVLVLDFDLAWHQDALDGATLRLDAEQNNGYLAPEQLSLSRHHLTRRPLVDSFGLGMVLYYLAARRHPEINQYMFSDWEATLAAMARANKCREWQSVPMRFIRIILNSTRDEQASRWDMTKIEGELTLLFDLVSGRREVITAELLAEELIFRASTTTGSYEWHADREFGRIKMREGFELDLRWDERQRRVLLTLEWLQTGNYKFESLKKYIGIHGGEAERALRDGDWQEVKQSLRVGSLSFEAFIPITIVETDDAIAAATQGLISAYNALGLLSVKAQ